MTRQEILGTAKEFLSLLEGSAEPHASMRFRPFALAL
jgi:hypothetical protein